ncbi:MAG TPA: hypothetical protein VF412_01575 [Bdellovibrio sp.]|uniref:hypothetical protein n=1 Tax=Bdellovibrio sp. TaxID=28201 RepID=UPI002EF727F9
MKVITTILVVAFLIITGAMISLIKRGVSLRPSTLITPSEVSANLQNISHGVAYRLFPDFQSYDLFVVGVPADNAELQQIAKDIKAQAEALLKQPIHEAAGKADLQNCAKPCWVTVTPDEAQELTPGNPYIEQTVLPLNRNYLTLTLTEFTDYDHGIISQCENEKRLDFPCLKALSIQEAQRKMKDPKKRYFFLRQYRDHEHFLFIQKGA